MRLPFVSIILYAIFLANSNFSMFLCEGAGESGKSTIFKQVMHYSLFSLHPNRNWTILSSGSPNIGFYCALSCADKTSVPNWL